MNLVGHTHIRQVKPFVDFTVSTLSVGNLLKCEVFNPIGCVDGSSEGEHNFVNRLHIPTKSHDLCGFILDILQIFELLSLATKFTVPVDNLILGAVGDQRVGTHAT
jgi:hypothetical protein